MGQVHLVKHVASTIAVISLTLFTISDAMVRRYHYDAMLYVAPSPDSPYVQYSRTNKDHWKNLHKLMETNSYEDHSLVCTMGEGAWLLYPQENYLIGDRTYITLIVGEACLETENIASMQPLGGMRDPFLDGIIVFPKDFFQSDPKHVSSKNGSFSGEGGSIIYNGNNPWLINNDVCLFPVSGEMSDGICLIPTLDSSLRLSGSKTIKSGCTGDKVRMFNGQNCYGEGVHDIPVQTDFNAKAMAGICGSGGGDDMKGKLGQVMDIWKGRVTKGIEDDDVIKYPSEGKNMVNLLFKIVGVFHEICPAVSPQYLSILKNIFVLHTKNVWAKGSVDQIPSDEYWRHATVFIDSCYSHFGHGGNPLIDDDSYCIPVLDTPDEEYPDSGVMWDMMMDHNYDTVIEQVWYIFNAISPACNLLNEYKTNDWILMGSLLKESFFNPVSLQWEKPGPWQRLYEIMFHGFDIEKERKKILVCVQHALASTPIYDPIGRTKYFANRDKEERMKMMKAQKSGGTGTPSTDDGDTKSKPPQEDKEEEKPEEKAEEPSEDEKPSPPPAEEEDTTPEEDDDGDKGRKKRQGAGKSYKPFSRR